MVRPFLVTALVSANGSHARGGALHALAPVAFAAQCNRPMDGCRAARPAQWCLNRVLPQMAVWSVFGAQDLADTPFTMSWTHVFTKIGRVACSGHFHDLALHHRKRLGETHATVPVACREIVRQASS